VSSSSRPGDALSGDQERSPIASGASSLPLVGDQSTPNGASRVPSVEDKRHSADGGGVESNGTEGKYGMTTPPMGLVGRAEGPRFN